MTLTDCFALSFSRSPTPHPNPLSSPQARQRRRRPTRAPRAPRRPRRRRSRCERLPPFSLLSQAALQEPPSVPPLPPVACVPSWPLLPGVGVCGASHLHEGLSSPSRDAAPPHTLSLPFYCVCVPSPHRRRVPPLLTERRQQRCRRRAPLRDAGPARLGHCQAPGRQEADQEALQGAPPPPRCAAHRPSLRPCTLNSRRRSTPPFHLPGREEGAQGQGALAWRQGGRQGAEEEKVGVRFGPATRCGRRLSSALASRGAFPLHSRLCIIAGDISPIDVITHIPVMCEDVKIPYCYVPSKEVRAGPP